MTVDSPITARGMLDVVPAVTDQPRPEFDNLPSASETTDSPLFRHLKITWAMPYMRSATLDLMQGFGTFAKVATKQVRSSSTLRLGESL